MSLSAITRAQHIHPSAVPKSADKQPPSSKSQPEISTQDTLHLSSAAQQRLSVQKAAAQEAAETPAQTAKEAQTGDRQAQRLLAKG